MPSLTHTNANGVTYSYDTTTGRWGAEKEGKKKVSYKSTGTLQRRLAVWASEEKHDEAMADEKTTRAGLALISAENGFYGRNWTFSRISVIGGIRLLEKTGQGVESIEPPSKNGLETSRYDIPQAVDPRTFDKADHKFWKDAALRELGVAQLAPLKSALADTWKRLRSAQIASLSDPVKSAWPVLGSQENPKTLNVPLPAAWAVQADGALAHPSGVRVEISGREYSPGVPHLHFRVMKPEENGVMCEVFDYSDFPTVSQIAELTVAVVEKKLPRITQWQASSSSTFPNFFGEMAADNGFQKVDTVAVGYATLGAGSKAGWVLPCALRTPHFYSHPKEGALAWTFEDPYSGQFFNEEPAWATELSGLIKETHHLVDQMLSEHQIEWEGLVKMDGAAKMAAYADAQAGHAVDEEAAVQRMTDYLKEVAIKAAASAEISGLKSIADKVNEYIRKVLPEGTSTIKAAAGYLEDEKPKAEAPRTSQRRRP